MVFAKLIFFPPNFVLFRKIFLSQNTKKSFGGKKINLAKKVGSFKLLSLDVIIFERYFSMWNFPQRNH
jgi:hypothetical protein